MFKIIKIFLHLFLFILKGLGLLISVLLMWVLWNYATSPVYDFPQVEPFQGESYFNPYRDINPEFWKKGNFQAQSAAWGGITAGSQNSNEEICEIYHYLGYDFIGTSDYQKINTYACDPEAYISVYEHGFGIMKNHQILIGSKKVLWREYPFYQTLSNKQHIIDLLNKDNELIYIAHPDFAGGNKVDDLRHLSRYNGVEFQSIYTNTPHFWDAALSSGNYTTGMGNDDLHDINNTNQIGRFCNFINVEQTNENHVIEAMRKGKSYVVTMPFIWNESLDLKQKRFQKLPIVESVQMNKDTLTVVVSDIAKEIRFVGQDGKLLKSYPNDKIAKIVFDKSYTYLRPEVELTDGTIFYLNAIARSYNGEMPVLKRTPEINKRTTLIKRIAFGTGFFILIGSILITV